MLLFGIIVFIGMSVYVAIYMIQEIKHVILEDKLYKTARNYVDRWYRHAGIIPSAHTIWKYSGVPKYIAREVYKEFKAEKEN